MRIKRLTGLLPAIISTALQVSLKTAPCPPFPQEHPAGIAASLGCHELVDAQPDSNQWLFTGCFYTVTTIQAVILLGEVVGGWHPYGYLPRPWSLLLCLRSGSAASPGGRLETAVAGCHSDEAFAQHPSNSAALVKVV